MSLILQSRFTRQPSFRASIDRSNPLCVGLSEVALPPNRSTMIGQTFMSAAKNNVLVKASPTGSAFSFQQTPTDDRLVLAQDINSLMGLTTCTIFCVRRCLDTTARVSGLFGYLTSGIDQVLAHAPWSDGSLYWDFGNEVTGRVSVSFTKTTKTEALVFIAGGGKGREVWRDGIKIIGNTGVTASRPASTSQFNIGGTAGFAESDNVEIYLFGVATRAWCDAEVQEWTRNPWQIFQSPKRSIFLPGTAAPAPEARQPQIFVCC